MARPTPSSADDDRLRTSLTERIRQLMAAGQLPGIARYYPHYGPEAPPPARDRTAGERR